MASIQVLEHIPISSEYGKEDVPAFDPDLEFDRWQQHVSQALPEPSQKIIAHMFGDSFIQNSPLEGLPLNTSVQFLLSSLEANFQEKYIYPFSKREEAIHKLKQILYWEEKLETARTSENLHESLTLIAQEIIQTLDTKGSVLLPGGWLGLQGGHAMLYSCEKEGAKKTSAFTVMNTGSGIQYHASKLFDTKVKHQFARKTKKINEHIISHPEFFVRLLGYRAFIPDTQNKAFTAEQLYFFLENMLGKKIVVSSDEPDVAYITEQQSGTCSWKVIMNLLRQLVPIEEYRTFKCSLYICNLSIWLEKCQTKPYCESDYNLLRSSADAFKKFIQKTKALDWLDVNEQWNVSILLSRIEQTDERLCFQTKKQVLDITAPSPCKLQDVAEALHKRLVLPPPFLNLKTAVQGDKLMQGFESEALCSGIKGYVDYAEKLYKENRPLLQDFCKKAFDTFPLLGEGSVWTQIEKDSLDELIKDIFAFSKFYGHAVEVDTNGVANRLYLFRTLEALVQRAIFLETGSNLLPSNLLTLPVDLALGCSISDPLAQLRLQKLCVESPKERSGDRALGYFQYPDQKLEISFSNSVRVQTRFLDSYLEKKGILAETRKKDPDYLTKAFTEYCYLPECVKLLQHQFFAMACGATLLENRITFSLNEEKSSRYQQFFYVQSSSRDQHSTLRSFGSFFQAAKAAPFTSLCSKKEMDFYAACKSAPYVAIPRLLDYFEQDIKLFTRPEMRELFLDLLVQFDAELSTTNPSLLSLELQFDSDNNCLIRLCTLLQEMVAEAETLDYYLFILKLERTIFEHLNLKTAVGPSQKVQDFESESVGSGAEHSQTVKAAPLPIDYGSKDCAFWPDPTAVFRLNAQFPSVFTHDDMRFLLLRYRYENKGAIFHEFIEWNKRQETAFDNCLQDLLLMLVSHAVNPTIELATTPLFFEIARQNQALKEKLEQLSADELSHLFTTLFDNTVAIFEHDNNWQLAYPVVSCDHVSLNLVTGILTYCGELYIDLHYLVIEQAGYKALAKNRAVGDFVLTEKRYVSPSFEISIASLQSHFVFSIHGQNLLKHLGKFGPKLAQAVEVSAEYLYLDPLAHRKNKALTQCDFPLDAFAHTFQQSRFQRYRSQDEDNPHLVLYDPESNSCYVSIYSHDRYLMIDLSTELRFSWLSQCKELQAFADKIREIEPASFIQLWVDQARRPKLLELPRHGLSFTIEGHQSSLRFWSKEHPGYFWDITAVRAIKELPGTLLLQNEEDKPLLLVPDLPWNKVHDPKEPFSRRLLFNVPHGYEDSIQYLECIQSRDSTGKIRLAHIHVIAGNCSVALELLAANYQNKNVPQATVAELTFLIKDRRASSPNQIAVKMYAAWLLCEAVRFVKPTSNPSSLSSLVGLVGDVHVQYSRNLPNISKAYLLPSVHEMVVIQSLTHTKFFQSKRTFHLGKSPVVEVASSKLQGDWHVAELPQDPSFIQEFSQLEFKASYHPGYSLEKVFFAFLRKLLVAAATNDKQEVVHLMIQTHYFKEKKGHVQQTCLLLARKILQDTPLITLTEEELALYQQEVPIIELHDKLRQTYDSKIKAIKSARLSSTKRPKEKKPHASLPLYEPKDFMKLGPLQEAKMKIDQVITRCFQ